MDYPEYLLEPENTGNELGEWEWIQEFLEASSERSKSRVENRIQSVYDELENRREVYKKDMEELEQRIKDKKNRLGSLPKKDEVPVRKKLQQLRDSMIQERKEYWRDVQDLKRELRDLVEKLDKL